MSEQFWVEVEVKTTEEALELVIAFASEIGTSGFWETDESLKCYFKKDEWDSGKGESFLNFIKNLEIEGQKVEVSVREFREENWNKIWEESIEPIEVGEKFVIKPSWKEYRGKSKIVIQIDPKMAFGTGHHETTRLMLRAIEKYLYPGCKILDVGTGSGILSIAAVKLGAEFALGVDNDKWAYENALENAKINGVEDKFKLILGSIEDVKEKNFDFIFANINKNAVIAMMKDFQTRLKKDGFLITSGFLDVEQGTIEEYLLAHDFEIVDVLKENEWVAIVSKF